MKHYFAHIDATMEYGFLEEEFMYTKPLREVVKDVVSTTRYYASKHNFSDAWQAEAEIWDDDEHKYICTIIACSYESGIEIKRVFNEDGEYMTTN